ncbi:MAG: MFS transporter [Thermincola sp.]|nr:MFS transporter [Thermincola sp.]MDT3704786.1 MFS transporter [Thermincola sp.]
MNEILEAPKPRIWNKAFSLNLVVSFLLFLSMYMLLPTVPLYAQTLGGSQTVAGLIVGFFTFSAVLVRPWFGILLDQKGRRFILIIGTVIILLSVLAHNVALSILILLALKVTHGIGWGAASNATGTIASDVIPPARRAEGMGYYGVSSTIAMSLGPASGLYLIKYSTFTVLFIVASIIAALGLAGSFFINYEKNQEIAVKRPAPTAPKGAILEKAAIPPSLVLLFIAFTYGGIVTFLPPYAATRGVQDIGLFFTVYALVLLVSRPIIGKLADRYGGRVFLPPGILIIAGALVLLTRADSLPLFLLCGVVYGIGFATVHPILNALVIALSPPERRGAATATFFVAMDLGIGIGSIILGYIIQKAGYIFMYTSSAICAILALVVYYAILHRKLTH